MNDAPDLGSRLAGESVSDRRSGPLRSGPTPAARGRRRNAWPDGNRPGKSRPSPAPRPPAAANPDCSTAANRPLRPLDRPIVKERRMGNPARNHESQHDDAADAAAEPQPRHLQRQGHGVGCQETEDLNVGKHMSQISDFKSDLRFRIFFADHRLSISAARKNDPVMQIKILGRCATVGRLPRRLPGSSKAGHRRPVNSSATCCNSSGGTARELFE